MGNTFQPSSEKEIEKESLFVTEQERQHLQDLYSSFKSQNGSLSGDKISLAFEAVNGKPIFRASLVAYVLANCQSYELFEAFIVECTRQSSNSTTTAIWKVALCCSEQPRNVSALQRFLQIVVELSVNLGSHDKSSCVTVSRLQEFIELKLALEGNHSSDSQQVANVLSVINNYMPYVGKALESHISRVCFGVLLSPSHTLFCHPTFDTASEIVSECDLLPMALHSDSLQGSWKRLYSTSVDGQSFNRIAYHVLGYDGPTCLLIKCQDPQSTVLGILAHDRWKDSNRFYGSSKNALFVLAPKLRIYRSKHASSGAYQWLNTKAVTLPHGMGFGGTVEGFRVFIPESLEECVANHSCPTYETGKLVEGETFNIHTLEIWGCGGAAVVASALQAQSKDRAVVDENIRKARQVDKAQFFNNDFDKEFFLSNTTSYGDQERFGNA